MVKAVRRMKHVISSCLVTSSYVAHSMVAINWDLNWLRNFGSALSISFSATMRIKELTYSCFSEKVFFSSVFTVNINTVRKT